MFASVFFPNHKGIVIFSMYILGIVIAILSGFLLKNTAFKNSGSTFILELPPYRLPSFRNTMAHMWEKAKGFLIKAGTTILVCTVILWFVTSFSFSMQYVADASQSMIAVAGRLISWIFIPAGFGTWQAFISLVSGFIAKENIISTMAVLYSSGSISALPAALAQVFTPVSAVAFMCFTLLYVPCVATVATIRRESNSRMFALKTMMFQTGVAYIVAVIVNTVGSLIF